MLPKSKRLTGKDFIGLKTRIVYRGACFDLAYTPRMYTKYACVISKKRIKRSVDRTRAKRKIYAALQGAEHSPAYIIIYPTQSILTIPFVKIKEELQKAFATL